MKFKTTQKFIKNSHIATLSVGYCSLYNLLSHKDPISYTTRLEGWASDVYSINSIAISTGYSPFGQSVNYSLVKEYEDKAIKIRSNNNLSYEKKSELLDVLIDHFLLKATGRV